MATISNLNTATEIHSDDYLVVSDGVESKKATVEQVGNRIVYSSFAVIYEMGIENLYRLRITKNHFTNEVNLHLDVLGGGIPSGSIILDFATGQYLSNVVDGVAIYTTLSGWVNPNINATWADVPSIASFTSGTGAVAIAVNTKITLNSHSYSELITSCFFDTHYTATA